MNASSLQVGQKIELNDGRVGTVRFVGATSFQTGDWVGIELGEATGKNDGSVKGERYFQCAQGYGMFLRPAGVRQVLEQPTARAKITSNGVPGASKAANGINRHSLVGPAGRRASAINSSPTPGARAGTTGIRSPAKSPTKQLGSNGVSSTSTSRTNTPPAGKQAGAAAASNPRQSLLPPGSASGRRTSAFPSVLPPASQRTSRLSLAPRTTGSKAPASATAPNRTTASKPSLGSAQNHQRLSSTAEEETSEEGIVQPDLLSPKDSEDSSQASQSGASAEQIDEDHTATPIFAPPPIPPEPPEPSPTSTRPRRPSSPAAASVHSQRTIRSTAASNRQIEELEAKVRLLERKRLEDREARKGLEHAEHERDQYKGIIDKLQRKVRPQQQEIVDLKQALDESEKRYSEIEATQAEHDSILEMATLDQQMAEETADTLKTELEALRAHNEEIQLELDILREENGELTKDMSPEERENAGWVQLKQGNDRLRSALMALRDRSLDEKAELQGHMQGLEEQLKDFDKLRAAHEEVQEKLLRSEADTEDLRQQLEVAMQSDEIIEGLTDRNGRLESAVSDLRATIEDLEDLKELNDELEINHVEAEKQLQEEIDFKDSLMLDRERTAKLLQEALDDRDYNISQFRSYVTQLQSDMADMKASKEITETDAKSLEGRSKAMLDLNLRLQNSAAKTQVKTIDLELRKLDAQEASEHLAIVQLFLPEAFRAERDSVLALLRFKRVGFKAQLVHGFIKERVASFGSRGEDEDVFAACDALDKLTWIAGMAERFVNSVCSCSVEQFSSYESAYHELEPVERALNSYVDGLRREEIHERDMAQELQRSLAVMSHLASLHINEDLASYADDLLMRSQCLISQLESAAIALQLCKSMVETHVPKDEDDDHDEGSASDLAIILNRTDTLVNHTRSAKVMASKTQRSLADLQDRSLTLDASCDDLFDSSSSITAAVVSYTQQTGMALQTLFGEEGRNDPFTSAEVASVLSRTATSVFSLHAPEAGPFTTLSARLRDLTDTITDLASLPTDLDNTVEFERAPAPWVARANELKQTKLTNVDTEAELARTLDNVRSRDVVIKEKEVELEEQSVRIEMLEARMKDASKRSAKIAELERALHDAKDAERRAKKDVENAREEKDKAIDRAREEAGRHSEQNRSAEGGQRLADDAVGASARMTLQKQEHTITSLEGAIRYLKAENHHLRLPPTDSPLSAQSSLAWIKEPLVKTKSDKSLRQETLHKNGNDLLRQMLSLASLPQTVDLTSTPENKLAWRPAKESSRWKVERRKEEFESWKQWRRDIVRTAQRPVPKVSGAPNRAIVKAGVGNAA